MKKILAILLALALMLVASMAVLAMAVTPSLKHPGLPQLPEFEFDLGGWWGDVLYRSTIAANVYTPEQYPAGWEVVE